MQRRYFVGVYFLGPPSAKPVLAPLSFPDLEPLTRNPDDGPFLVPCNQELDCASQVSFHIIFDTAPAPVSTTIWAPYQTRFMPQDDSIDEDGSPHKGPVSVNFSLDERRARSDPTHE